MKKLVFCAMSLAAAVAFGEMKIGTVDMLTLVRNHKSYETNKQTLTDTEKDYQKKLDREKGELEKIQDDGRKLAEQTRNPMLSEAAKQKLEKDLMDIQTRFLQGQQRLRQEAMRSQQELQDLEGRLLKRTTEDLRKNINDFAESNGYDFIFDASAVPFAKRAYDVTPGVLKKMGVDPAKAVTAKAKSDEGK